MEATLPPQYEDIEILCAEDNIVLQRMLAKWFHNLKLRVDQVCLAAVCTEPCPDGLYKIYIHSTSDDWVTPESTLCSILLAMLRW